MRKVGELFVVRPGYAAFVALLCSLLPLIGVPFGFLAVVMVGYITLCRGPRSGLFVLAWVALPALAMLYLRRFSMVDSLFVDAVLVWLFAFALRRLGSWRWVFEISALIGVIAVIVIHMVFPNVETWWVTNLTKYLAQINESSSWRLTATQTSDLIRGFAPIATGSAILVGLFWTWLLLILVRWWQASIYFPGRLRDEFVGIRNRIPMAIIMLIGLTGFVIKQPIVIDAFPVLLYPLMMGGLSFMHYLATVKKGFSVLVILVYLGLVLLPFVLVVLLALVGFCDTWINFRKFVKTKGELR